MSIRDEISGHIGRVYRMGALQERGEPHYYSPYSEADAILALVREALLSPEAKIAGGKSLYQNRVVELDQSGDDDWEILPWQDEWIEGAGDALAAALAAAGITGEPR